MAKLSLVERGKKQQRTVVRLRAKRKEIKERLQQAYKADEGVWELQAELQKLPRNAGPTRLRRRCNVCGRSHGVYRKFGLCRLCIRKLGMKGFIPGLEKASW